MKKNSFVAGTLWLSGAGLFTRLLGFVWRIFLSNRIGSEGMGLYQLLMPVYFLLYTLCTSGICVGISRLTATRRSSSPSHTMTRIVWAGLLPAVFLSLLLSGLLFFYSDFIAVSVLGDGRAASGLRILCLSLPFCTTSSCCKAYFHGLQQMTVPAVDQILEQLIRMGTLLLLAPQLGAENLERTCRLVVWATVAGDVLSCFYAACAFARCSLLHRSQPVRTGPSFGGLFHSLFVIALPVTAGRVITQLLSCFENIMLPAALQRFGCSSSEALSLFGVFGGMVMPILLFPSVLTGSVSANLLPVAARACSAGDKRQIRLCIDRVLRFTFLLAFLVTALLSSLGDLLGAFLYPGTAAGALLMLLAVFCPFLYLQGTLGGLLNGLGLQNAAFLHQLLANAVTVLTVLLAVPRFGFPAFLGGYFLSLLLSSILNLRKLIHTFARGLSVWKSFSLPLLACAAAVLSLRFLRRLPAITALPSLLQLAGGFLSILLFYLLTLFFSGSVTKKDLSQVLKIFG